MASHANESTRQTAMDVNRSLRTIKTELERLLELGAISDDNFSSLHDLLPQEWSLRSGAPASSSTPSTTAASTPQPQQQQQQQQPPPLPFRTTPAPAAVAAAPPPAREETEQQPPQQPPRPERPGRAVVGRATAKYAYDAPNDGDLAFARGDALAVFSQVNADWWLGRHEPSGRVGIFPRQYVRPEPALAELERAGRVPLASEQEEDAATTTTTTTATIEDAGPAPPAYQRGDDYYGEPKAAYGQQQQYGQPAYGQPVYGQQQPYGQPVYGQPQQVYGQPQPGGSYGPPQPYGQALPPAGPADGGGPKNGMGKKIGGKLGNAFITGVGFAAGAEVVGAIL